MIRAQEAFLARYHALLKTEPSGPIARKLTALQEIYRDFETGQRHFAKGQIDSGAFQNLCRNCNNRLDAIERFLEKFRRLVSLTENIRAEARPIINSSRAQDRQCGQELHALIHEADAWIQGFLENEDVVVDDAMFRRGESVLGRAEAAQDRARLRSKSLSRPPAESTISGGMARRTAELLTIIEREATAAAFPTEVILELRDRQQAVIKLLQKQKVSDAFWYVNQLHVWLRDVLPSTVTAPGAAGEEFDAAFALHMGTFDDLFSETTQTKQKEPTITEVISQSLETNAEVLLPLEKKPSKPKKRRRKKKT